MSITPTQPLPSTRRLLKATASAIVVATITLFTTVLPAEYGIVPTGIGARLGLDALAATAEAAKLSASSAATTHATPVNETAAYEALAAKAAVAFGENAGQSFDTKALSSRGMPYRRDNLSVMLPPGKGAEVKALLKSGDGMVFHWKATGDVALDMHGERTGIKNAWTSYAVESVQREASGTFVAPFDGSHG